MKLSIVLLINTNITITNEKKISLFTIFKY